MKTDQDKRHDEPANGEAGGHGPNGHGHGHGHDDGHDGHGHANHQKIVITVNEQPVTMNDKSVNGAQIKAAAIAQGVLIKPNFVLQEELPNGTGRVVGDEDPVHLRPHMKFTAIQPDDNS